MFSFKQSIPLLILFIFFFFGDVGLVQSQCTVNIGKDSITVCNKNSYSLTASGTWNSYKWSNGATTATTTAVYSGDYSVEVSKPGCVARDTIFIQFFNLKTSPDTLFQCQLLAQNISADTSGILRTYFQPFNLSSVANFSWSSLIGVDNFPVGNQVLKGVPFDLKGSGNMAWAAEYESGNNPKRLTIKVGKKGCVKLHTLINTMWGQITTSSYASVQFYGNVGTLLQEKKFLSNNDFRDYQKSPKWANNINNSTSKNIWINSSASKWLDMQTISLNSTVQNSVLDSIVFVDIGGRELQRMVIYGVTVEYNRDAKFKWSHGPTNLKTQSSSSVSQNYIATVYNDYGYCRDTVFTKIVGIKLTKLRDTQIFCNPIQIGIKDVLPKGYTLQWNTGETIPMIQITQAGIYTVKVSNSYNCEWYDTINVLFVNDAPNLDSISGKTVLRTFQLAEYQVKKLNNVSYKWDYSTAAENKLITPNKIQLTFSREGWHKIKLYAQSINGCVDSVEKDVFVLLDTGDLPKDTLFIPNAFNPYGVNQQFKLVGFYLRSGQSVMKIFDRWGGKIFEGDALQGWDGTFSDGEMCPTGIYIYIIEVLNNQQRRVLKGTLLLLD